MAHPVLSRFVALGLGLAFALGIAEVVVRTSAWAPARLRTKVRLLDLDRPNVFYDCYPSNPRGAFDPAPDVARGRWRLHDFTTAHRPLPLDDLTATPWCVRYRLSSLGLRNAELASRPPPGVVRMLGVGDSFAFGEGVPVERTLFARLDAMLGARTRVVNIARSALDLTEEVDLLARAARLGATRAILVVIANDVALTPTLEARQHFIDDLIVTRDANLAQHVSGRWYAGPSRLLRMVGAWLDVRRITRDTVAWYRDAWDPAHNPNGLAAADAAFRRLARLDDCRVGVVIYPLMIDLDNYPLTAVHTAIARLATDAGLPVLDLAPAFRGHLASDLTVHPADHHPNGDAHAIAAEAVAAWLSQVPEFLSSPASPR